MSNPIPGDGELPTVLSRYQMVIDAGRVDAVSGKEFSTEDPYRGQPWATVPDAGSEDVDLAVAAARRALLGPWGKLTGSERARLLRLLGDLVARDAARLAAIETRETGKLLREMSGQLGALPEWFYFFAGLADKLQGAAIPTDKANYLVYTRHEPVGVVAAIVPWNSPLLLLAWKLAPALAAGCTVVAKPSEYTPTSALELMSLIEEAGFPPGTVNVITGLGSKVGQALTAHPGINKIAFTGSTLVGTQIAKAAADHLTRLTLELGGKSAHLVFADADLDAAANGVVAGVFAATGQTCMAGSRLLVQRDIHDDLVQRVVARAETIKLGDPSDQATEMGPIANPEQYRRVLNMVNQARESGADVVAGGEADTSLGGYFFKPTVLTNVRRDDYIVQEEVFGPVLAVLPFDSEDEAIEMANESRYGLAAAVWTKDIHRGHRVAHRLRAGSVWINAYRTVSPSVPFGGYGLSGIGRENGIDVIREYTETKAVWVELTGSTRDPFTLG